ncbi:hypothetical protein BGZ83_000926 [Gryganskiella cystojenkinii]|nr:hypothetical protein BGZ83_000926 [Gryganskiella cystojenkinii]
MCTQGCRPSGGGASTDRGTLGHERKNRTPSKTTMAAALAATSKATAATLQKVHDQYLFYNLIKTHNAQLRKQEAIKGK